MKAVILAAGKGKRLEEYTKNMPKCLLKLGTETILEREIRILRECGIQQQDIYVIGGYRHELLKPYSPNLIINPEYESKDNSYSLGLALDTVNEDTLILDADLCFGKGLINELLDDPESNVLLSKVSDDTKESTGIVVGENNLVQAIGKNYVNTGYVYISIFKIEKAVIPEFRRLLLSERSKKTWYTLAITELCKKYRFFNHVTEEKWHEIDFIDDYKETLQIFGLRETK